MDDVTVAERHDLERVYREQGRRLWWAVVAFSGDREIASDAVAEAFAQALRGGDAIRAPEHRVWRVAFRLAAGELKRRGGTRPRPEEAYEMDHRAQELLAALARLSPRQRGAIVLHYYAGYTAREIGAMTGSSGATVAVHLHRGRKRLREILEDPHD